MQFLYFYIALKWSYTHLILMSEVSSRRVICFCDTTFFKDNNALINNGLTHRPSSLTTFPLKYQSTSGSGSPSQTQSISSVSPSLKSYLPTKDSTNFGGSKSNFDEKHEISFLSYRRQFSNLFLLWMISSVRVKILNNAQFFIFLKHE